MYLILEIMLKSIMQWGFHWAAIISDNNIVSAEPKVQWNKNLKRLQELVIDLISANRFHTDSTAIWTHRLKILAA